MALTQDVDMLASFPGSFTSLAVRAGPYWEAGRGPWNKAIDVQLPTLVSRSLLQMTPKKNGGCIKSAQMTHSKCLR